MDMNFVLVTGATGFIGAHVVDALLRQGIRVRGATRSPTKGEAMIAARPEYKDRLEFVRIDDFERPGGLEEAVRGVDGVVHVASPFTYVTSNNEKELILPAINGVNAILAASSAPDSIVRRVVMTSSFAAVVDVPRSLKAAASTESSGEPYFTYTASDWNPLTYEESIEPSTSAVVAYRGSKKFAELAAWEYMEKNKPNFDLVSLCPPMTFGPVVHPVHSADQLNESNAMIWQVAVGNDDPIARVPFWIDVRDLADAHVGALIREQAGGKRYTVAAPERFSYGLAAGIIKEHFEGLRGGVQGGSESVDGSHGLDGERAGVELGVGYRSFGETVRDLVGQVLEMEGR
ncbi:SDR family oxidoreductase [Aspergillus stella-maris]|uniref:SDR family oxidoreductase n=1 Tax=Aspergillus stella-maris TaxID=1810926 RepID=UPI003CCCA72A